MNCGKCECYMEIQSRCGHPDRGPLREVDPDGERPRLCPLRRDVAELRTAENALRHAYWTRTLAMERVAAAQRDVAKADEHIAEVQREVAKRVLPPVAT
jgi:hypothetical protein